MRKQIDKAFGKKVYLLGMDKNAIKYWLEEPKWDCGDGIVTGKHLDYRDWWISLSNWR